ncbi:putative sigma-70, region 3 domain containing protein [Neospora caninum Liverpool]|uniref:Putative sigma-70, region 3 domain containing protein n=1 Tax=Neospora caninum (strain Liverpool) TaxID=572307 RepID=F0VAZ0_NEOCL|nr:putative sigma-70, region 3 domain containing protein [Neospora caninum Liverpool]CBZ51366.1 putative sigma-70, region 3 domain containing protein [Neospora caninum Liverpool]CEL68685.1 TPA: sigma-70, region 3 domain containing protein,putative [Neospora caninum Liverpool]|eukprot:XP_003881399.1 putative sigma-70, region 3 domain containing protein [Neospora caninum Liverpool]
MFCSPPAGCFEGRVNSFFWSESFSPARPRVNSFVSKLVLLIAAFLWASDAVRAIPVSRLALFSQPLLPPSPQSSLPAKKSIPFPPPSALWPLYADRRFPTCLQVHASVDSKPDRPPSFQLSSPPPRGRVSEFDNLRENDRGASPGLSRAIPQVRNLERHVPARCLVVAPREKRAFSCPFPFGDNWGPAGDRHTVAAFLTPCGSSLNEQNGLFSSLVQCSLRRESSRSRIRLACRARDSRSGCHAHAPPTSSRWLKPNSGEHARGGIFNLRGEETGLSPSQAGAVASAVGDKRSRGTRRADRKVYSRSSLASWLGGESAPEAGPEAICGVPTAASHVALLPGRRLCLCRLCSSHGETKAGRDGEGRSGSLAASRRGAEADCGAELASRERGERQGECLESLNAQQVERESGDGGVSVGPRPASSVAKKSREEALEELEKYERIRDSRLLMSWDAWARGIGKSPEYLKNLVTLAYASPTSSLQEAKSSGGSGEKADSRPGDSSSPAGKTRGDRSSCAHESDEDRLRKHRENRGRVLGQRGECDGRAADEGRGTDEARRSPGKRRRTDAGVSASAPGDAFSAGEEKGTGQGPVETGDASSSRQRKVAGSARLHLQIEERNGAARNEPGRSCGGGDQEGAVEVGPSDAVRASEQEGEASDRFLAPAPFERASGYGDGATGTQGETIPAQVARATGRRASGDPARPPPTDGDEALDDSPETRWAVGKLVSKREYARLLSLLRVEAIHATLEGSENEEEAPVETLRARRPPTLEEWAGAATGGDVKLLGEKLRESRALLDVCLRRLHPLATVAVRRFRSANIFAAQQRKLYQDQGDYDAIRALLEKRNEEEMELLLVALQGIRQGLRRHARTAMRRRVRLLKAASAANTQDEEEGGEGGGDEEAREGGDEDGEEGWTLVKETKRGRKGRKKIEDPHETGSAEDDVSPRLENKREIGQSAAPLPELPPPPSVAYWLWMRTAMVDWEQQKRQVTQFPWRWWREAARGRKASHGLYAELGREPTEAEVADRLGISLDKWQDISVATKAATALEAELGGPHGSQDPNDRQDTVGDLLASEDSAESDNQMFETELETQVLDLAAESLQPDEYRMVQALISEPHAFPGRSAASAGWGEEKEAVQAQTLQFMVGDCVDEKLKKAIQKMKEAEVKRILESLSPEERREGLASPDALEKVVQRKSAVLQLCLAASTKQGFE